VIPLFFRDLRAGLQRRWYLVLVGIALTVLAAGGVFRVVPATYEATASVILVPPAASIPQGANPYLYLGGLTTTVDVLSRALSDEQTRHGILGDDTTIDYAADPDRTSSGPILLVTTSGPTPEATMGLLKVVVAKVPVSLEQIQSSLHISSNAAITSITLTQDDKPTPVQKTRIRLTLAAAAGTAALSLLLIGLTDGLLLRRQARVGRRAQAAGGDVPARRARRTADDVTAAPPTPAQPGPAVPPVPLDEEILHAGRPEVRDDDEAGVTRPATELVTARRHSGTTDE